MSNKLIGRTIAGCRIQKKLGQGGMGTVYKAWHINLDIPVALKILDYRSSNKEDVLRRFFTEARATARLDSQHIVRIMQVGEDNEFYFIQMEFVQGETLQQKLTRDAPIPIALALKYLYQITLGLHAAHQENIVHRDIKPENILISHKGIIKIVDFGVAKLLQNSMAGGTQTGQILGTPHYLSPEQCEGKITDARSDIYSLGIVFYLMITGHLPFSGDTALALVVSRLHNNAPAPVEWNPDLPEEVSNLTLRMMARSPLDRYHAGELLEYIPSLYKLYSDDVITTPLPLPPVAATSYKEQKKEASSLNVLPTVLSSTPDFDMEKNVATSHQNADVTPQDQEPENKSSINARPTVLSSKQDFSIEKNVESSEFSDIPTLVEVNQEAGQIPFPSMELEENPTNPTVIKPEGVRQPEGIGQKEKQKIFLKTYALEIMFGLSLALIIYFILLNTLKFSDMEEKDSDEFFVLVTQLSNPSIDKKIKKFIERHPASLYNKLLSDILSIQQRKKQTTDIKKLQKNILGAARKRNLPRVMSLLTELRKDNPEKTELNLFISKLKRVLKKIAKNDKNTSMQQIAHEIKKNIRAIQDKKTQQWCFELLRKKQKRSITKFPVFFNKKEHSSSDARGFWAVRNGCLIGRAYGRGFLGGNSHIRWSIPTVNCRLEILLKILSRRTFLRRNASLTIKLCSGTKIYYSTTLSASRKKQLFILDTRMSTPRAWLDGKKYDIQTRSPANSLSQKNSSFLEINLNFVKVEIYKMHAK